MSPSRQRRLTAFRTDITAGKPRSDEHLFGVLFGLPADLQRELARHMVARFSPIYETHHPQAAWVQELLAGVDEYFSANGKGLAEEPETTYGGDPEFRYALHGLSDAWSYARDGNLAKVCTACCTSLIWAISARASNVWYADDPEAARGFERGDREACRGRGPRSNVAAVAVAQREWLLVADWLEEHQAGDYPQADDDERGKWFEWWQERECNL